MSFRDGVLKVAEEPLPSKVVATRFGEVKVMAASGERVGLFRRALGDKASDSLQTPGGVVALVCFDPATGAPSFAPEDIAKLNQLPPIVFDPVIEAINEIGTGLTLDPTTPATPTGSG